MSPDLADPALGRSGLAQLYTEHVRRRPWLGPDYHVEVLPRITRVTGGSPAMQDNFILHNDLDDACAADEIRAQCDWYAAQGRAFEWKVCAGDQPHDLGARLIAAGGRPDAEERVMVMPAADPRLTAHLAPPCELRPLRTVRDLADFLAVVDAERGPGHSDWLRPTLEAMVRATQSPPPAVVESTGQQASPCEPPHPMDALIAAVDGQPAGASRVLCVPGCPFAYLFGGTVLPAHRGRGIYRAMVAARAQEATRRGVPYLIVDAGSMSAPILARLGFEELTRVTGYAFDR